jgi:signal transduction histidine kinase
MARYDGSRFRFFPEPASAQWHDYRLLADRAGRVWISTGAGNELRRIDDPSADTPHIRPYRTWTVPERGIVLLVHDEQGRIYLRTTRGVARLDPETGRTRRYTTADGLAHLEAQAAYRDRHGALWFATGEGLSRLVPETDEPASPPAVAIGAVRVAGNAYPLSDLGQAEVDRLVIRPNDRQLDIEYFALNFQPGDVVRYQVKLEGTDGDWSASTTTPAVTYAYLRPGRYRFLVRAVSARGTTSDRPATIAFTVLAPVWQRWWFLALSAAAVAAAVHAFYRARLKRLLELERIRTRIASDLHDDIGSGLSRLAIMSEVVQRKLPATEHEPVRLLADMSNTARHLVDAMGDIVWAIAPREEDLGSVIARVNAFAAEVLERKGITYDFEVGPAVEGQQLSPDQRRHLLLILKEGITNIARHSGCHRAVLTISVEHGSLRVLLADDGRGVVPGVVKGRGGHGLRSMQDRAAAVRGHLEISGVEGSGTRIELVMPLT